MPEPLEYQPFPNETSRNSRQEGLEVPALVRLLDVPCGVRVLEVGCGRGVALPVLARLCRPERLVGLDFDAELLAVAGAQLAQANLVVELVHADVRDMPFADASFDVVLDFGTLYHIARPRAALAEIARVLAPGGQFVHETRVSQRLSHPARSHGRTIPWHAEPSLASRRWALLWASRTRA